MIAFEGIRTRAKLATEPRLQVARDGLRTTYFPIGPEVLRRRLIFQYGFGRHFSDT